MSMRRCPLDSKDGDAAAADDIVRVLRRRRESDKMGGQVVQRATWCNATPTPRGHFRMVTDHVTVWAVVAGAAAGLAASSLVSLLPLFSSLSSSSSSKGRSVPKSLDSSMSAQEQDSVHMVRLMLPDDANRTFRA